MSIESVLFLTKQYLSRSVSLFPILIATVSYFLFAGLGNIAFLFLFIGLAIVVPASVFVMNLGFSTLLGYLSFIPEKLWKTSAVDCMFRGGDGLIRPVVPSYWMAAVIFFVTYFLSNAVSLYTRDPPPGAAPDKIKARKAQAGMGIALILILGLILVLYRTFTSTCETTIGILISLLFIPIANAWFELLKSCSADRLTDLFGVVTQIVPSAASASQRKKQLCY